MDLDQLHTFLEIVRLKSFSKAAQSCFRTQPAVSAQVRQLEQDLNAPLFERLGTKIALTPAGHIFADYAEQILALRRRAQDTINELERAPRGELVIAANEATCIYVLPRVFSEFKKHFPNVQVLDTTPADWDVTKVARIWETLLTKYPQIDAAFFHNDDMALAAYNVMKQANRTNILIGGVDAMPPALDAVLDGRMHATVRNPSCRIHGGAILGGVAAVVNGEKTGEGGIPKHVITDGPVVTKDNAPGMMWMEGHYLI